MDMPLPEWHCRAGAIPPARACNGVQVALHVLAPQQLKDIRPAVASPGTELAVLTVCEAVEGSLEAAGHGKKTG